MDLGARQGSETMFEQYRRSLEHEQLPERHRANYLRDVGRGCATFGRFPEATVAFQAAGEIAQRLGLHQLEFEVREALADLERVQREQRRARPAPASAPDDIAATIEELLGLAPSTR